MTHRKIVSALQLVAALSLAPSAADCFTLYASDNSFTGGVLRFDTNTSTLIDTFIPVFTGGLANAGSMAFYNGSLLVNSGNLGDIKKFDAATGAFQGNLVTHGVSPLFSAAHFALDRANGSVLVGQLSPSPPRLLRYDAVTGARDAGFAGVGSFPSDEVAGPDGSVYVADFQVINGANVRSIQKLDGATGGALGIFVPAFFDPITFDSFTPIALDFGPDGNLYAVDPVQGVFRFDGTTGALIDKFIPVGGDLQQPRDFIFGPDGNLYLIDANSGGFGVSEILEYDGATGDFVRVIADHQTAINSLAFAPGPVPVPEPSVFLLLSAGLVGLGALRLSRRARSVR